ncbi:hematopoietic SH2 domain-containing protein [Rhinatrema bivittatum]|uniref:hematopoietic SH2 domain-containing protein n=1 Tax=Rhinatrema bivittatum TaxID=194408 RepID=UPI001129027A|nr:hematopoietic SH2 domain-containing protein [Rhinatrema bivittatum]XP_029470358.1 hematopoietic SH2 domain-containing protein [Rhinatrema bivittatum]
MQQQQQQQQPRLESQASVKWFVDTQAGWFEERGIPEWFHGAVTRKDAENVLQDKPPGCFLVRVSESRIGYSLSYRAGNQCRHFMINMLDDGQFLILGDKRKHKTLEDLLNFHALNPIQTYNELLIQPCQQKNTSLRNYENLFPRDKIPLKRINDWPSALQNVTSSSSLPLPTPPLPDISENNTARPPVPCPRMRPALHTPPVPLPRKDLDDLFSGKMHKAPSPLQVGERGKLYPLITAEMRAMSVSNDSTSIMSSLYPWKNNMKKSKSVDCLDLLDTKLEIVPEDSSVSRKAQIIETPSSTNQVKTKSNNVSNSSSPTVGKKLKKYIPLMNKALPFITDGKLTLSKREMGAGGEKATVCMVNTHSGHLSNEDTTCLSGNANAEGKPHELGTLPAIFRNNVLLVPNKLRSGAEKATPCKRRLIKSPNSQEEYQRPPPFAPGF